MAIAMVPASAPGPKTATKNSAQIIACTERVATRMKRPMLLRTTERVMFRATMTATRLAMITARIVPSVAVCSVSINAPCTTFGYHAQSIGHIRANKSTVCCGASYRNSGMISMLRSDNTKAISAPI